MFPSVVLDLETTKPKSRRDPGAGGGGTAAEGSFLEAPVHPHHLRSGNLSMPSVTGLLPEAIAVCSRCCVPGIAAGKFSSLPAPARQSLCSPHPRPFSYLPLQLVFWKKCLKGSLNDFMQLICPLPAPRRYIATLRPFCTSRHRSFPLFKII